MENEEVVTEVTPNEEAEIVDETEEVEVSAE